MPSESEIAAQKAVHKVKQERGFVDDEFSLPGIGKKTPKRTLEHLVAHSPAYPYDNFPHGVILVRVIVSHDCPAEAGAQVRRPRLRL